MRSVPFHTRAVDLIKKRDKQLDSVLIDVAKVDIIKKDNLALQTRVTCLEQDLQKAQL